MKNLTVMKNSRKSLEMMKKKNLDSMTRRSLAKMMSYYSTKKN